MEVIIYKARADVAIDLDRSVTQSIEARSGDAIESCQAAIRRYRVLIRSI